MEFVPAEYWNIFDNKLNYICLQPINIFDCLLKCYILLRFTRLVFLFLTSCDETKCGYFGRISAILRQIKQFSVLG